MFQSFFGLIAALVYLGTPLTTTHAGLLGEKQYLSVHGEKNGWQVELIDEVPGQLPSLRWRKNFTRETDARRFAAEAARKDTFAIDWLRAESELLSKQTVTEVPGISLWKVTQSWSWEWEQRYAQWVKAEVTPHFFVENSIATDCADVAYSLRWIFARMKGLPAANHLMGSGVVFSQDSIKAEWMKLPADEDWKKDQRFMAALNYLMKMTYTHTLLRDSYPITISAESLLLGTHHLEIHGDSGHTMLVHKLDLSDTSVAPLEVMYSTTPRIVRELMENGYWNSHQPKEEDGGFLRIRWPLRQDAGWELATPESHPFFSKEQYTAEFMTGHTSFAEAILLRLNPKLDFSLRLKEGISYLREQIRTRVETVVEGYAICAQSGCAEGSADYEGWSTFSRDTRLGATIAQIEELVGSMQPKIPGFGAPWEAARMGNVLKIGEADYTLGEVIYAWKVGTFSSDPRVGVDDRWGTSPRSFTLAVSRRLKQLLEERGHRIAVQGASCGNTGVCTPGTEGWIHFNTYDIDADLQTLGAVKSDYCRYAKESKCADFSALLPTQRVIGDGKDLPLSEWLDQTLWLISDPRVSSEMRWGSQRNNHPNFAFNLSSDLRLSASGLAISQIETSPFNTIVNGASSPRKVFDLIRGLEILPPDGMSWTEFDRQHDWVIARTPNSEGNAPTSVQVIHPRNGLVYNATIPSRKNLNIEWMTPGVLRIFSQEDGVSLVDLTRTPRFEVYGLPQPAVSSEWLGSVTSAWISKTPQETYEVISYLDGQLSRSAVQGSFGEGNLPISLLNETATHLIGRSAHCPGTPCQFNQARIFSINKRDGTLHFLTNSNESFHISQDGVHAIIIGCGATECKVEFAELGPNLEILSRLRIGQSLWGVNRYGSIEYVKVMESQNVFRRFRLKDGILDELRLLPDEVSVLNEEGNFINALTVAGTERIRGFDNPSPIFESQVGGHLKFSGSRQYGQELRAVIVNHPGEEGYGSLYDLRNPSQPLLTGKTGVFSPEPTSTNGYGGMIYMGNSNITRARGLLIPYGNSQKLWIDDENVSIRSGAQSF